MANSALIPNSFQHPNVYVDRLAYYLTPAEEKVLNKAIREIYGWHDKIANRRARISISVFTEGKRHSETGEVLCLGCGLSSQAVRDALASLDKFGILLKVGPANYQGQLFQIQDDESLIDWDGLKARKESADEQNRARTEPAIVAMASARQEKATPPAEVSSDDTPNVPHNPVVLSDIISGVMSDSNKETHYETHKETQIARVAPVAPPGGKKSSKGGTRARQKDPPHEAVKVFRDNASRFPAKSWYGDIIGTVGTDPARLEFWGKVVKQWVGLGWNPTNVTGMLDHYRRGELPGSGYKNGGTAPPAQTSTVRGL